MSDLDQLTKQITALAAALASASKAGNSFQQAEELRKALKAAKDASWDSLPAVIEGALSAAKSEAGRLLAERRQKLLEAVKAKGVHYRFETDADTVDVFKIRYKGATAVIEFAGVEVDVVAELDGAKLADAILAVRARLEKAGFERSKFFAFVKAAISHANAKKPSRDGYVDLGSIYRELVFEQAWSKGSFAKSGAAKHFPEYPFHQFLWDLARFVSGGSREGQWRLEGRTPAMSERATTYSLPNPCQPQAQATVLHTLRVNAGED